MYNLFFLFIIIIVVVSLFSNGSGKKKNKSNESHPADMPYSLKNNVLTRNEHKFFESLKIIADENNIIILPKVRLADFIHCPRNTKNYYSWFNKIKAKHIDFLLCDVDTRPLLAIELEDSSHDTAAGHKRDKFIDDVYHTSKLAVVHFRDHDKNMMNEIILDHIRSEN